MQQITGLQAAGAGHTCVIAHGLVLVVLIRWLRVRSTAALAAEDAGDTTLPLPHHVRWQLPSAAVRP
jgi:hypothetical protein